MTALAQGLARQQWRSERDHHGNDTEQHEGRQEARGEWAYRANARGSRGCLAAATFTSTQVIGDPYEERG